MNTEIKIQQNLERIRALVPSGVEIVAVSKFHPVEMIMQAYDVGQKAFGESRVQELLQKEKNLPKDIRWHFIGHLQSNKVKSIIGKTYLIESVDSEKLLNLINKESQEAGLLTRVLLQVHVAMEESKFGFYPEELLQFIEQQKYRELNNIEICGLMAMASNTDDIERVKADFNAVSQLFHKIQNLQIPEFSHFNFLSMGMSGDWPLAVEKGANIVRIGSAIFGEREY